MAVEGHVTETLWPMRPFWYFC